MGRSLQLLRAVEIFESENALDWVTVETIGVIRDLVAEIERGFPEMYGKARRMGCLREWLWLWQEHGMNGTS